MFQGEYCGCTVFFHSSMYKSRAFCHDAEFTHIFEGYFSDIEVIISMA